jgi:CheY-like chemotaxis protein
MPKILHVEDDVIMLKAISRILEKNGYQVVSAKDGKQAFDILDIQKDFDLIITDIMLPYNNGLEIVAKIKTDSELRDIPIIIISSVGNEEIVRESFRLGAEDFIKKPVMSSELLIKIKRVIDKKISVVNKVFVTKRKK